MKIGYCQDWCGQATLKYIIVAETTDGQYILKRFPIKMIGAYGNKYWAEPPDGLIFRDKSQVEAREEDDIFKS